MTNRGALIDFSGTLFRLEYTTDLITKVLGEQARSTDAAELLRLLTAPVGLPSAMPDERAKDWHNRDLDGAAHRRANVAMLRFRGLSESAAGRFYESMLEASSWQPYPDTAAALRMLAQRGIRIAVVSNIAWDIRAVFRAADLDQFIDEYVFSFEVGVIKPDPKIFTIACDRLEVDPRDTVMIGDSAEADGGATEIGCGFCQVEPLPVAQRPDALLSIVQARFGE